MVLDCIYEVQLPSAIATVLYLKSSRIYFNQLLHSSLIPWKDVLPYKFVKCHSLQAVLFDTLLFETELDQPFIFLSNEGNRSL